MSEGYAHFCGMPVGGNAKAVNVDWQKAVNDALDPVNPAHYRQHPSGVECIQITEHMTFNLGNAIKYIWRAGLKGATEADLEKARWYIAREIERLKRVPK